MWYPFIHFQPTSSLVQCDNLTVQNHLLKHYSLTPSLIHFQLAMVTWCGVHSLIPSFIPSFIPFLHLQPATVSRCGMIYLEPSTLGWRPIMTSWIHQLPDVLKKDGGGDVLSDLMEWLVDPCLEFMRKNCKVG